jgi:predicted Na+-dependent transporter
VIGAGALFGIAGNVPACIGGALVGGLVGLFAEPILYSLGLFELNDPFVEAVGMLAVALVPAVGATVGFNWGTADP